jgi:alpha/beta superfamily hydrolase
MVQGATRGETVRSGDLNLEGVLHLPASLPAPGVVVCHPHPQYGGDMGNNVVVAICEALTASGIAGLRFNTRGTGRSDGSFDNGIGERDDLRAAQSHLSRTDGIDEGRVAVAGYSFGAMIAAEVAGGDMRALVLVSPPLSAVDIRVGWGCPAFVIGSDADHIAPVDRLRVLADAPGAELLIISGADHSWWGFEDELSDAVVTFLSSHLA